MKKTSYRNNQCSKILQRLRRRMMVSPKVMNTCGVYRLAARIFDLRESGYEIKTIPGERLNTRYVLVREPGRGGK